MFLNNNPIVSLVIACYNQEWCIREALEGAFSQTYSPLEIVISDDCSTDSTWQIVNEMTDRYRKTDGRHKVILNRNPENSYRASQEVKDRIRQHVHSLWNGELIVQADGDDVSLPNRVQDIVDAWLENDRVPDLIFSGSLLISKEGKPIGVKSCYSHLSGSSMAYTRRMELFFGGFRLSPLHGDDVRFHRAKMLGGVVLLDKSLVKYRVCGGYSQVHGDFRTPMVVNYRCVANSRRQNLIDVELVRDRDPLKYEETKRFLLRELKWRADELPLWESESFRDRFGAFLKLGLRRRFLSGMVVYAPLLLLPHRVGDPILNCVHGLLEKFRGLR